MSPHLRFLQAIVMGWLCASLSCATAQSGSAAGDLYFDGFQAWRAGEKLEQEGNKQAALQKYLEAHKAIKEVGQNFPEWQPEVVGYRLKNVEQSLARLGYAVSGTAVPAPAPSPTAPTAPGPAPMPQAAPGLANPLDIIKNQFDEMQRQNADMAGKLKLYQDGYTNALTERQKAEGDRDLLIQQMKALNSKLDTLTKQSGAKDAAAQQEIQKLRNESKMVADLLATRAKQFDDTNKIIESLKKEKEALLANQKKLEEDLAKAKRESVMPGDVAKLMAENTRLKQELDVARKQVETMKTEGTKKDQEIAALKTQLTGIQTEIAKLRQENTVYQTQVADLTVKLKEMNSDIQKPTAGKPDSRLAKENETLRAIIMRHLRQQERLRQSKEMVIAEMKKLEVSSTALMENLEDMTSGKVRVTVDEESLFSEPELKVILASNGGVSATLEATSTKSKTGTRKVAVPVNAASSISTEEKLMVQADQALQSKDFREAEKALQDALRANPKNTAALISLAGIKLNEKKQAEAEVLLQKCLVYEPDNASALYRLGVCYFQQSKMTDALASFEKSVLKDKNNARAHHYLGIISNSMSNRPRAEAEFKSALAIDPGYGDAHFNLAVLYATSNPPDFDKAREHYRNALQRGIVADPALEKLIKSSEAPTVKVKNSTVAR